MNNFYVLTGGPGVGKTSLIHALSKRGFHTVEEDARRIIKQQVSCNEDGVPWLNKARYAQLMFDASLQSYTQQKSNNTQTATFFDRGLIDTLCYIKMERLPLPHSFIQHAKTHRYNPLVFLLPPWPEIYTTDSERKQNWEEVLATHALMEQTYIGYGYQPLEVPKTDLSARVDFVVSQIKQQPII